MLLYIVRTGHSFILWGSPDAKQTRAWLLAQEEEGYPIDTWSVTVAPPNVEITVETLYRVSGTEFAYT